MVSSSAGIAAVLAWARRKAFPARLADGGMSAAVATAAKRYAYHTCLYALTSTECALAYGAPLVIRSKNFAGGPDNFERTLRVRSHRRLYGRLSPRLIAPCSIAHIKMGDSATGIIECPRLPRFRRISRRANCLTPR